MFTHVCDFLSHYKDPFCYSSISQKNIWESQIPCTKQLSANYAIILYNRLKTSTALLRKHFVLKMHARV